MENITLLLTPDELKANGFLNANVDNEYVVPAIEEAQDVFLREILGDSLLNKLTELTEAEQLDGKYEELVEGYVKYYLKYKTLGILCMSVNFKIRNMGVINQYGPEVGTTTLDETKYIQNYYVEKADFYANRMTRWLELNKKFISEYKVCCKQVTNPEQTHPVSTIYLG